MRIDCRFPINGKWENIFVHRAFYRKSLRIMATPSISQRTDFLFVTKWFIRNLYSSNYWPKLQCYRHLTGLMQAVLTVSWCLSLRNSVMVLPKWIRRKRLHIITDRGEWSWKTACIRILKSMLEPTGHYHKICSDWNNVGRSWSWASEASVQCPWWFIMDQYERFELLSDSLWRQRNQLNSL